MTSVINLSMQSLTELLAVTPRPVGELSGYRVCRVCKCGSFCGITLFPYAGEVSRADADA